VGMMRQGCFNCKVASIKRPICNQEIFLPIPKMNSVRIGTIFFTIDLLNKKPSKKYVICEEGVRCAN
jgi:hypothetical protein